MPKEGEMPDTNGTTDTTNPTPAGSETPPTWESILSELPEDARGLYEQHTQGLKHALDAERKERKDLSKQLQDASQQLEAGSKARTDLEALQARLEETERRADFATEAGTQGVVNVRLAYLAAQEFETFDRRGNVQWDALREAAPELFAQPQPARGNAGSGTAAPGNRAPDIDALIRASAGR